MRSYVAAVAAALFLLAGCGATTTTHGATATDGSTRCYADYLGCPSSSPSGSPSGWFSAAPSGGVDPVSHLPWILPSQITPEGRTVLTEIDHGGPFRYPGKDGSVFGNFEGVLPKESRGYYHEYTVPTPGGSTRGTRRIITGSHHEFYWTADHYEHFERIKR